MSILTKQFWEFDRRTKSTESWECRVKKRSKINNKNHFTISTGGFPKNGYWTSGSYWKKTARNLRFVRPDGLWFPLSLHPEKIFQKKAPQIRGEKIWNVGKLESRFVHPQSRKFSTVWRNTVSNSVTNTVSNTVTNDFFKEKRTQKKPWERWPSTKL